MTVTRPLAFAFALALSPAAWAQTSNEPPERLAPALSLQDVDPTPLLRAATDPLARQIPYQGVLTNGGVPVTGPTSAAFRLFDAATGGTAVWTESQAFTPDAAGRFSVRLGAVTPLPTDIGQPLWLQVTTSNTILLPRTALGAAPYALGETVRP